MVRQQASDWYKDGLFYEVYIRAFCDSNGDGDGDLPGLTSKLDYLHDLGVNCIWLLPMYESPLVDSGYDIADYYRIHPMYGTVDDLRRLLEEAHRRGMRVIADLVMNHTSDQHAWFKASRDPNHPQHALYRDWYMWSTTPDKYRDTRIIFVDSETSNWTYDERRGEYYLHRFFSRQPDLNFDNPAVQAAMLDVIRFWLDVGLDGFRADAVPYLFKREGTSSENLPETHAYLKRIRRFIDEYYPGRILLAEANQWPEDVQAYFGDGDEFTMAFHFPLMPRIFMALKQADRQAIIDILRRTPPIPESCQWCTFLRCHDELTLEMVSEEERQFLWRTYAPQPRMRLNLGIRRRLAPLLDNDRARMDLAHSLLFTLPGTPIVYYGDEIGMGDNIALDDRDGVRTPMQWSAARQAGFSSAAQTYAPVIDQGEFSFKNVNVEAQQGDGASLLSLLRRMIVQRRLHHFGRGDYTFLTPDDPAILAYVCHYQGDNMLLVNNLAAAARTVTLDLPQFAGSRPVDVLSGKQFPAISPQPYTLSLAPSTYLWLQL